MNATLTQLWKTRSLADCGQFFSGGTPNRSIAEYWGGSIPWISAKSLKTFRVSDSEERVTESGAENGTRMVPPGTLLFVVRGMSLAKEFRVAVTTGPVTFNQDLRALVPSSDVDPVYLTHFLRASEEKILGLVDHASHGTTRLTSDRMDAFEIPIPPIAEQRRIAEVLDRAEALRTKRRATLAQLDTLTQSIFLDLFGAGSKWPIVGVGEACVLVVDCVNRTAPTVEEPTPFRMIRTTNVRDGVVDLRGVRYVSRSTFETWNRRATPRPGDVLLTREAPVGEAGILREDGVFLGQRLMLYRPDPTKLTSEYLLSAFRGPLLQQQFAKLGSGTTVKHLPLPACRGFEVPLPPLKLQQTFAQQIAAVEKLKSAQRASLAELDALFATLQHRAFRGEL
ncbi:MAG: restriction endonuclease subunit S [Polyangiaceae bacterium]